MTGQDGGASRSAVEVELYHAPTLNFAMEQSGVPVVTAVLVTNRGGATLDGLQLVVRIDPALADPHTHPVGRVRAGEAIELSALDLRLRPGKLRTVIEAE